MKTHIGVDAGTGFVHSVEVTAANVHDVDVAHKLIREDDDVVYGDSGYLGLSRRPEIQQDKHKSTIDYRINRRPSQLKMADSYAGINWDKGIEHQKFSVRSKVEHAFLIVKQGLRLPKGSLQRIGEEPESVSYPVCQRQYFDVHEGRPQRAVVTQGIIAPIWAKKPGIPHINGSVWTDFLHFRCQLYTERSSTWIFEL